MGATGTPPSQPFKSGTHEFCDPNHGKLADLNLEGTLEFSSKRVISALGAQVVGTPLADGQVSGRFSLPWIQFDVAGCEPAIECGDMVVPFQPTGVVSGIVRDAPARNSAANALVDHVHDEFQIGLTHARWLPDERLDLCSGFPKYPASGWMLDDDSNPNDLVNDPQKIAHPEQDGYVVNPADMVLSAAGKPMMPFPAGHSDYGDPVIGSQVNLVNGGDWKDEVRLIGTCDWFQFRVTFIGNAARNNTPKWNSLVFADAKRF